MADKPARQKLNTLTEIESLANLTVELAGRVRAVIERWQSFAISPQDLVDSGILTESNFNGLSAAVLANWLGSMDSFAGTATQNMTPWYNTHGVNARLMVE